MNTALKTLALVLAIWTIATTASAKADDFDYQIELVDGILIIQGDWTIDVVRLERDDDEIEVRLEQYESQENYDDGDPDRTRTRDFDLEDVDVIYIDLLEGNDEVDIEMLSGSISGDGIPKVIHCGPGDDTVVDNESAFLNVDGGSGDDFILAQFYIPLGISCTSINGGDGDDTILGSEANDSLFGGGGEDLILGRSGDDYLDGGEDDDELIGGSGDDYIVGGNGSDDLFGEIGADYLIGGNHELIAKLESDDGADYLDGGDGDDVLFGGYDGRVDTLVGGADEDRLYYRIYSRTFNASGRGQTVVNSGRGSSTPPLTFYDLLQSMFTTTTLEVDLTPDFDAAEGDKRISLKRTS